MPRLGRTWVPRRGRGSKHAFRPSTVVAATLNADVLVASSADFQPATITAATRFAADVMAASSAAMPAATIAATELTTGLVSYWPLDEFFGTRNDAHGTNHLTDINTVAATLSGKLNSAASFVAANLEALDRASNASLQMGDTSFTITAWVYPTDLSTGSRVFVGKFDGGIPNSEYYLGYSFAANRFYLVLCQGSSTNVSALANTFGAPALNAWHFLVAWYDATTDLISIQVNDGAVDTNTLAGGTNVTTTAFRLGATSTDLRNFDGLLDEVGLWKRVLSAAERTRLYNGGAGLAYPAFLAHGATLPAEVLAATAAMPTATITAGASVTAGAMVATTATAPAATVRGAASLPAGVLTAPTAVFPAATMTGAVAGATTVIAGTLAATAAMPVATIAGGTRLTVGTLGATAVLQPATLGVGAALPALVMPATAGMPAAALSSSVPTFPRGGAVVAPRRPAFAVPHARVPALVAPGRGTAVLRAPARPLPIMVAPARQPLVRADPEGRRG